VLWRETQSVELLENLEVAFFISKGRGSRVGSGCFSRVTNGVVPAEARDGRCRSSPKFSEREGSWFWAKEQTRRCTGDLTRATGFVNFQTSTNSNLREKVISR